MSDNPTRDADYVCWFCLEEFDTDDDMHAHEGTCEEDSDDDV